MLWFISSLLSHMGWNGANIARLAVIVLLVAQLAAAQAPEPAPYDYGAAGSMESASGGMEDLSQLVFGALGLLSSDGGCSKCQEAMR